MRRDRFSILLAVLGLALGVGFAFAYTPPPTFRDQLNLQPVANCKNCHIDISAQWEKSAHSKADRTQNLLFGRMYFYSLRQTRGATMVACGPCHETASFVNQDFENVRQVSSEGVACVFCHSVDGPGAAGVPPLSLELGPYTGTIRNPVSNNTHTSKHAPYLGTSEFCGSCHKYSNQHGVEISDTYGEWKRSKYAKQGVTCQTCHMPGAPGRNSSEGPVRPRVADHSFDPEVLAAARPNAVTMRVTGERRGDSLRVFTTVTNAGWGHSLPTGNDQNIALIRVRVKSAAGEILWENDPFSEWHVAVFGILLADEFGNAPAETWSARKLVSNRRLKVGESARVRFDVPLAAEGGTAPKGALRVEAQFLMRRARPETVSLYGLSEDYDVERVLAEGRLSIP